MRLGVPDLVTNSYFPAIAAVELGFFKDEGFDVDIELIYPNPVEALRSGDIDLVASCAHDILEAFPQWHGAKLLMALSQHMYWQLIMGSHLQIRPGDLNALAGLRIGAAKGVDIVLIHLLKEARLDPKENGISIGPVRHDPNASFGVTAAQALRTGEVDGFWANAMGAETALRSGVGSLVLDVRRGIGPSRARHYTFSALIGRDDTIRDKPEFVKSAIRAVVRAQQALFEMPELARKIGDSLFPPAQAEMITDIIRRDVEFYDADISEESIHGVNQFSRAMGLLTGPVSFQNIVADTLQQLQVHTLLNHH